MLRAYLDRVPVAVRKSYQAKVFPNAGPMAKPKGKVDEGTGSAELINSCKHTPGSATHWYTISH